MQTNPGSQRLTTEDWISVVWTVVTINRHCWRRNLLCPLKLTVAVRPATRWLLHVVLNYIRMRLNISELLIQCSLYKNHALIQSILSWYICHIRINHCDRNLSWDYFVCECHTENTGPINKITTNEYENDVEHRPSAWIELWHVTPEHSADETHSVCSASQNTRTLK